MTKLNRKNFGKKIKADEISSLALEQLQSQYENQLIHVSLSNFDRLKKHYWALVKADDTICKQPRKFVFPGKKIGEIGINKLEHSREKWYCIQQR